MKKILLLIAIFLLFNIPSKVEAFAWPSTSLSFYGKVSFLTSYAQVDGNVTDFIVQNYFTPGLDHTLATELNLEGQIDSYYLKSTLTYPVEDKIDLKLLLENRTWRIESQIYDLKIPTLKTTFNTQKLKGFKASRRDGTFHLFTGTKQFQTITYRETVFNEDKLVYNLFDSTAGDIVENSELVFLQGKQLQRYIDYKINFLSGELKFLIPLHFGDIIEVKYNYLPTGETVNDTLSGIYYQYNFARSNASVFYFDEINEVKVQSEENFEIIEHIEQVRNRYLGSAVNIISGPVTLSGELACTDPTQDKYDYAGNVDFKYSLPEGYFQYILTTATKDFKGIGVVPVTSGESHQVSGDYQFNRLWKLEADYSRVKKSDDWTETITQNTGVNLNYQFRPKHRFTLSTQANSLEEWGTLTTDHDILFGWNYQVTDKITFSVKNSLRNFEKTQLNFKINSYTLTLNSEFKQYPEFIPFYGTQINREFNTDFTWRPKTGINFTTDIDYLQPLDGSFADSRRRVALSAMLAPTQKFNARSNFVYFYNPTTDCQTLFYDLNSTTQLPYNLQFEGAAEKIQIESPTAINDDQSWRTALTLPLYDQKLKLSYNLSNDSQSVFLKDMNKVYQGNDTLIHLLKAEYFINDFWSMTAAQSYATSSLTIGSSESNGQERKTELALNYFRDLNQFKYQVNYQQTRLSEQFSHNISWNNMWRYLQYNYNGEISHTSDRQKILSTKQVLDLNWINYNTYFRPSLRLSYQSKDNEGQKWIKQQIAGKLAYEFSWGKSIFIEAGNIKTLDMIDLTKNYDAYYAKAGVEYTF